MSNDFWPTISKLAVAVPIAALIGAGLSALVLGGIDYGQLRSSLDSERKRSTELSQTNEEYRKANELWRDTYTKLNSELSASNGKINEMRNDQCESIRTDISRLQSKIENAYGFTNSAEQRANMQVMMRQHQDSLQACFASRR
ncbi:hypothetical protein [Pseudomonas syringae]|uniref:hypothetical protein n=1 Tax=Pseudomonas syringae TaxID=317 RepID=UPI000E318646|nr:hypothetical protein [Pseudomonas syringae]